MTLNEIKDFCEQNGFLFHFQQMSNEAQVLAIQKLSPCKLFRMAWQHGRDDLIFSTLKKDISTYLTNAIQD